VLFFERSEANLSEADLSGAKGITGENLAQAKSLEAATMPSGRRKYEVWLETREGQEWFNRYKQGRGVDRD
jgi:hypothetical protein